MPENIRTPVMGDFLRNKGATHECSFYRDRRLT